MYSNYHSFNVYLSSQLVKQNKNIFADRKQLYELHKKNKYSVKRIIEMFAVNK